MFPTPSFLPVSFYTLFGAISTIVLFSFNLHQVVKIRPPLSRNLSWIQGRAQRIPILGNYWFWAVIESLLFSYVQYMYIGLLNNIFADFVGTGSNYFGLLSFVPYLLITLCFLLWTDPLKKFDLIVPAYPLALVFSKIACFLEGCCRGFECSWGFYNHGFGRYEFPSQLLEAAVALGLFFVLLRLRDKIRPGTIFPIYVILFSATRFFTEFTRHESNTIWFLKTYHLCCIYGLIYGTVLLVLVRKFGGRISSFFDSRMDKFNTLKS